tara:strand:- start:890 stop:1546 length:657 start_codon:yes stop_codon:yes gene_type:complete
MDYNQRHKNCIDQFKKEFEETAITVSGGANYAKVADRQRIFREHFPDAQVLTDLKSIDDTHVVFKTLIKVNDKIISSGWSRTVLKSKAKAIEFGETVSLGRCLANFGLTGDEYASIEEMIDVPNIKIEKPVVKTTTPKQPEASNNSVDDITKNLPDNVKKLFNNIIGQYDAAKHVPHLQQARTTNFMTIKAMEGSHPDAYKFLEDSYQLRKERMSNHA